MRRKSRGGGGGFLCKEAKKLDLSKKAQEAFRSALSSVSESYGAPS